MAKRLQNKVVLVTAAAQGIGRASAICCAKEGACVWATDINQELLEKLSGDCDSLVLRTLDVRDSSAIDRLVNEIGAIDGLLNCAGFVHEGNILECTEDEWDHSFDVNVKSMFRTCRAVLPRMLRHRRGSVVNIASVVSSIKGASKRFIYGTTKAAVIGLTKAIATDYCRNGIRCNAICPGTVWTPSLEKRIAEQSDPAKALADFVNRQPLGRLGTPEEIAALALYLLSDESTFTTGQSYVIDGGWSA